MCSATAHILIVTEMNARKTVPLALKYEDINDIWNTNRSQANACSNARRTSASLCRMFLTSTLAPFTKSPRIPLSTVDVRANIYFPLPASLNNKTPCDKRIRIMWKVYQFLVGCFNDSYIEFLLFSFYNFTVPALPASSIINVLHPLIHANLFLLGSSK